MLLQIPLLPDFKSLFMNKNIMLLPFRHILVNSYLLYQLASAQSPQKCESIGLDYADAGSYLVDGSAEGNFSFASEFQGTYLPSFISNLD